MSKVTLTDEELSMYGRAMQESDPEFIREAMGRIKGVERLIGLYESTGEFSGQHPTTSVSGDADSR